MLSAAHFQFSLCTPIQSVEKAARFFFFLVPAMVLPKLYITSTINTQRNLLLLLFWGQLSHQGTAILLKYVPILYLCTFWGQNKLKHTKWVNELKILGYRTLDAARLHFTFVSFFPFYRTTAFLSCSVHQEDHFYEWVTQCTVSKLLPIFLRIVFCHLSIRLMLTFDVSQEH